MKKFNRFVAAILIALSLSSLPVPSVCAQPGSEARSFQKLPSDLSLAEIPAELGKTQETFQGNTNDAVIILQDAHAVPQAQHNLQKLIDYFEKNYGADLVAVEGASSELDARFLRSFPEREDLRKTLDSYMERGELTGVAAAAILNREKAVYQGIEDWSLYEDGLKLYLKAAAKSKELAAGLDLRRKELSEKKKALYSKSLLEVDAALEGFESNNKDLISVLKVLGRFRQPESAVLTAVMKEAGSGAPLTVDQEVRAIAQAIQKNASPEFNEKYQAFQTSALSAGEFALWMKDNLKPGLNFSSRLAAFVENHKLLRDIEGTAFFTDFERYAKDVKNSLFRNEQERKLDQDSRRLFLLGKLHKLKLTRAEWDELKASEKEFEEASAFYENAEKRDGVFFQNLIALMKKHEEHFSLLVAGGFHAQGVARRLREKGISYAVVMPRIDSVPETNRYRELMSGDVSWKKYFRLENGKVNLYEAFARASRDVLLKDHPGMLKKWRDQIIRDLVKEEKVAQAGEYTSLIDEVPQAGSLAPWEIKTGEFLDSLRKLQFEGKFDRQNIERLLQPYVSTALYAAGGNADLGKQPVSFEILPAAGLSASRKLVRAEARAAQPAEWSVGATYEIRHNGNPAVAILKIAPQGKRAIILTAEADKQLSIVRQTPVQILPQPVSLDDIRPVESSYDRREVSYELSPRQTVVFNGYILVKFMGRDNNAAVPVMIDSPAGVEIVETIPAPSSESGNPSAQAAAAFSREDDDRVRELTLGVGQTAIIPYVRGTEFPVEITVARISGDGKQVEFRLSFPRSVQFIYRDVTPNRVSKSRQVNDRLTTFTKEVRGGELFTLQAQWGWTEWASIKPVIHPDGTVALISRKRIFAPAIRAEARSVSADTVDIRNTLLFDPSVSVPDQKKFIEALLGLTQLPSSPWKDSDFIFPETIGKPFWFYVFPLSKKAGNSERFHLPLNGHPGIVLFIDFSKLSSASLSQEVLAFKASPFYAPGTPATVLKPADSTDYETLMEQLLKRPLPASPVPAGNYAPGELRSPYKIAPLLKTSDDVRGLDYESVKALGLFDRISIPDSFNDEQKRIIQEWTVKTLLFWSGESRTGLDAVQAQFGRVQVRDLEKDADLFVQRWVKGLAFLLFAGHFTVIFSLSSWQKVLFGTLTSPFALGALVLFIQGLSYLLKKNSGVHTLEFYEKKEGKSLLGGATVSGLISLMAILSWLLLPAWVQFIFDVAWSSVLGLLGLVLWVVFKTQKVEIEEKREHFHLQQQGIIHLDFHKDGDELINAVTEEVTHMHLSRINSSFWAQFGTPANYYLSPSVKYSNYYRRYFKHGIMAYDHMLGLSPEAQRAYFKQLFDLYFPEGVTGIENYEFGAFFSGWLFRIRQVEGAHSADSVLLAYAAIKTAPVEEAKGESGRSEVRSDGLSPEQRYVQSFIAGSTPLLQHTGVIHDLSEESGASPAWMEFSRRALAVEANYTAARNAAQNISDNEYKTMVLAALARIRTYMDEIFPNNELPVASIAPDILKEKLSVMQSDLANTAAGLYLLGMNLRAGLVFYISEDQILDLIHTDSSPFHILLDRMTVPPQEQIQFPYPGKFQVRLKTNPAPEVYEVRNGFLYRNGAGVVGLRIIQRPNYTVTIGTGAQEGIVTVLNRSPRPGPFGVRAIRILPNNLFVEPVRSEARQEQRSLRVPESRDSGRAEARTVKLAAGAQQDQIVINDQVITLGKPVATASAINAALKEHAEKIRTAGFPVTTGEPFLRFLTGAKVATANEPGNMPELATALKTAMDGVTGLDNANTSRGGSDGVAVIGEIVVPRGAPRMVAGNMNRAFTEKDSTKGLSLGATDNGQKLDILYDGKHFDAKLQTAEVLDHLEEALKLEGLDVQRSESRPEEPLFSRHEVRMTEVDKAKMLYVQGFIAGSTRLRQLTGVVADLAFENGLDDQWFLFSRWVTAVEQRYAAVQNALTAVPEGTPKNLINAVLRNVRGRLDEIISENGLPVPSITADALKSKLETIQNYLDTVARGLFLLERRITDEFRTEEEIRKLIFENQEMQVAVLVDRVTIEPYEAVLMPYTGPFRVYASGSQDKTEMTLDENGLLHQANGWPSNEVEGSSFFANGGRGIVRITNESEHVQLIVEAVRSESRDARTGVPQAGKRVAAPETKISGRAEARHSFSEFLRQWSHPGLTELEAAQITGALSRHRIEPQKLSPETQHLLIEALFDYQRTLFDQEYDPFEYSLRLPDVDDAPAARKLSHWLDTLNQIRYSLDLAKVNKEELRISLSVAQTDRLDISYRRGEVSEEMLQGIDLLLQIDGIAQIYQLEAENWNARKLSKIISLNVFSFILGLVGALNIFNIKATWVMTLLPLGLSYGGYVLLFYIGLRDNPVRIAAQNTMKEFVAKIRSQRTQTRAEARAKRPKEREEPPRKIVIPEPLRDEKFWEIIVKEKILSEDEAAFLVRRFGLLGTVRTPAEKLAAELSLSISEVGSRANRLVDKIRLRFAEYQKTKPAAPAPTAVLETGEEPRSEVRVARQLRLAAKKIARAMKIINKNEAFFSTEIDGVEENRAGVFLTDLSAFRTELLDALKAWKANPADAGITRSLHLELDSIRTMPQRLQLIKENFDPFSDPYLILDRISRLFREGFDLALGVHDHLIYERESAVMGPEDLKMQAKILKGLLETAKERILSLTQSEEGQQLISRIDSLLPRLETENVMGADILEGADLHIDISEFIGRQEVRQFFRTVFIPSLKGEKITGRWNVPGIAQQLANAGLDAVVDEALAVQGEVRTEETEKRENGIDQFLFALQTSDRLFVDYVISREELSSWGAKAGMIIRKIIEDARNVNFKSGGKIMTRIILPEGSKIKDELPKDIYKDDKVTIQPFVDEIRIFRAGFPGSERLGQESANVTIARDSEVAGRVVLSNKTASGEDFPFLEEKGEDTGGLIYLAAVAAATFQPLQGAELLKTVGKPVGRRIRQQVKRLDVLNGLRFVAERLSEDFRSEARIRAAA